MRKILNFVKGAVSTKDLVPVLTNFHFYGGRVQGNNGRIIIDAPLDLGGVDITVPAVPFLKAVDACDGDPNLHITEGGRLVMKKGSFRSTLPLSKQGDFPVMSLDEEYESFSDTKGFIAALKIVRPFIGEDASRPWACGALFKEGYIYATNNVVMVRVPFHVPNAACFNLPAFTIDELIRIGEDPNAIYYDENSVAAAYSGSRWLRSQLFATEWPDVERFFQDSQELDQVPAGLTKAVQKVLPFCPDPKHPTILLNNEGVHTANGDMGASVEGLNLVTNKHRAEPLQLVLTHATHIDFTQYPAPIPFKGANGLQGVLVGLKE